ncbi:MAG: hypothetical protein L0213_13640, partial [Candidatus Dadabacteria bacterium]|nr:hypothetical protein [Candidatus Dadabacteria bacterium]
MAAQERARHWKPFRSVSDLPGEAWDEKVAGGHPARSSAFLRVLERACDDREFYYFGLFEGDELAGCCLVTVNRFDIRIFLSPVMSARVDIMRKLFPRLLVFRVAMT